MIKLYKCVGIDYLNSNFYTFNKLSNNFDEFEIVANKKDRLFIVKYDTERVRRSNEWDNIENQYRIHYTQYDVFYNGRLKDIEISIIKAFEKIGYNINENLRLEMGKELLRLENVKRADKYTEYFSKTLYLLK